MVYVPYAQDSFSTSMMFAVRARAGDAGALLPEIEGVVRGVDRGMPVYVVQTMEQALAVLDAQRGFFAWLLVAFATLSLGLAASGLYAVVSYLVARRTREIGVRMALGADRGSVRALVLRQVAGMFLIGTVIGILAALALGRAAQSLLFGLDGQDAGVIALATLVLALFALGAGLIPAARAARVHPMQALRYE